MTAQPKQNGDAKKKPGLVVEVNQGPSGAWYWRLRSPNGRILGFSEMFSGHHAARRAACLLIDHMLPTTQLLDQLEEKSK